MKKFLFVVMWVQVGVSIFSLLVYSLLDEIVDLDSQLTDSAWGHEFLLLVALYIAWRVTPASKPQ